MARLDTIGSKNDHISNLVDLYTKNNQLEYLFSGFFKLLDLVFQVLIVFMAPLISAFSSQSKKKINYLTNIMQSLAFSIHIL